MGISGSAFITQMRFKSIGSAGWGSDVEEITGVGTYTRTISTLETPNPVSNPRLIIVPNSNTAKPDLAISYRYPTPGTFDEAANLDLDGNGQGDLIDNWWPAGTTAFERLSIHYFGEGIGDSSDLQKMVDRTLTWYTCDGRVKVEHVSSDADGAVVQITIGDPLDSGGFDFDETHLYGKGQGFEEFSFTLGYNEQGHNCHPVSYELSHTQLPPGVVMTGFNPSSTIQIEPGGEVTGSFSLWFQQVQAEGDIQFVVTASGGTEDLEAALTYTVDRTGPAIGAPFQAGIVNGDVHLSWGPVTDAASGVNTLRLYRDSQLIENLDPAAVSAVDPGPFCGEHVYRLDARDFAGNLSQSTTSVDVVDSDPPSAPQNLDYSASGSMVTLTWDASTDNCSSVVDYHVYLDGQFHGTTTNTSYAVTVACTTDVHVVAEDSAGNQSGSSNVVQVVDVAPPGTPAGVSASQAACNVLVTWQAVVDNCGVTAYKVIRNGVVIATVSSTNLSYTHASPGPGTHTYRVKAVDAEGNESLLSNKARLTMPPCW